MPHARPVPLAGARDRAATSLALRFPHLAPSQILEVIKTAGPLRRDVESALERI